MSKSAIYVANINAPTVADGGIVPLGSILRRYGCNINMDGNAITLCGQGYYLVTVSATVTPSAAGTVTLLAQKDGVPIAGAEASATAGATDIAVTLPITCTVRNACGCGSSLLSLLLTGGEAVVNNLAVTVEKL